VRRLAITLLLVAGLLAGCTGGPAAPTPTPATTQGSGAQPTPTPQATAAASAATATEAPPTEAPATDVPATAAPGEPTPAGSADASSGAPTIASFKAPHTASCLADNGTGTVGMIRLTWAASGTTGVRISIDPPSPDVAYDYPYDDYPLAGSVDVPFACGPSTSDAQGAYHLYVVTTLKVGGYAFYRFAKVYDATPTP
jgi:hypothetical protein